MNALLRCAVKARVLVLGMLCLSVLLGLAGCGGPQSSPENAFEAFKKALVAKDADAMVLVLHGDAEAKKKFAAQLKETPAEVIESAKSAALVETKTEGDRAIGIVKFSREGKVRYDDQFFIRVEGKWHVVEQTMGVQVKDYQTLREWYLKRKKELAEAPQ